MQEEPNQESLLTIAISDDEIGELLRRIAYHDFLGPESLSTVRDITELTQVPPEVVVRMLAEIRGSSELEEKVSDHESRLRAVEGRMQTHKSIYGKFMRNGTFLVVASDKEHAARYRDFLEMEDMGEDDRTHEGRIIFRLAIIMIAGLTLATLIANVSPAFR